MRKWILGRISFSASLRASLLTQFKGLQVVRKQKQQRGGHRDQSLNKTLEQALIANQ